MELMEKGRDGKTQEEAGKEKVQFNPDALSEGERAETGRTAGRERGR